MHSKETGFYGPVEARPALAILAARRVWIVPAKKNFAGLVAEPRRGVSPASRWFGLFHKTSHFCGNFPRQVFKVRNDSLDPIAAANMRVRWFIFAGLLRFFWQFGTRPGISKTIAQTLLQQASSTSP
jgi:hypothetical protein